MGGKIASSFLIFKSALGANYAEYGISDDDKEKNIIILRHIGSETASIEVPLYVLPSGT